MKIDAAIFDIGNVLLLFDYMRAANRLVEKNRLTSLPDREKVVAAKAAYEEGQIDRTEFLRLARAEFQDTGDEADFVRIWEEIFEENIPMTTLARELSQSMPVYLLSNIGCIHHNHVFSRYPVFSVFKDGVFSYRAKAMKPAPRIYEIATTQFGVTPSRTLFIDDLADNIAAARAAGFITVHYDHTHHDEARRQIDLLLAS